MRVRSRPQQVGINAQGEVAFACPDGRTSRTACRMRPSVTRLTGSSVLRSSRRSAVTTENLITTNSELRCHVKAHSLLRYKKTFFYDSL